MRSVKARGQLLAAFGIGALALALVLPAAMRPPMLQDSFWIDWVWLDQFARQLGNGDLYPRWLFQSHGGLGSPVFYYYPPLAFYIASLFVLAGLSTYGALLAAFGFAFALSGAGIFLYLRESGGRPLLGAVVFMVAPYHVLNFYSRGALAESVATALIPFVALGIHRLREGRGTILLPLSYAALIVAHLPMALLVTVFFATPLIVYQRVAKRGLIALTVGGGLVAFYLAPALLLARFRDSEKLWALPLLRPGNWSVWSGDAVTTPGFIMSASAAAALLLAAVAIRSRWAAYAGACAILAVGIFPFFWDLPLLRDVQFPFRILPIAEFAIAVGIARSDRGWLTSAAALAPLIAVSFMLIREPERRAPPVSWNELRTIYPDTPENLPPGAGLAEWPSRWALDLAKRAPAGSVFHFPAWKVRCSGAPAPDDAFIIPPKPGCTRRLVITSAELVGWLLSLASVLGLFAWQFGLGRRAQTRAAS